MLSHVHAVCTCLAEHVLCWTNSAACKMQCVSTLYVIFYSLTLGAIKILQQLVEDSNLFQ